MGRRVLKSSLLDDFGVAAFFTTRDLPLKSGEREDLIEEVENNKRLVCEGLGIPAENLIIPVQTHSDNVRCIGAKTHRSVENLNISAFQPFSPSTLENNDALITDRPQIALALNFADCVPIIFYDPIKKAAAAAHAGWRGTAAKIGPKTVKKMAENFGSKPEDIIALIGPAIGKCCFEVGEDVKEKLLVSASLRGLKCKNQPKSSTEAVCPKDNAGKIASVGISSPADNQCLAMTVCDNNNIDLKQINKLQLLAIGVRKIDLCEYCTSCRTDLFFSYRKENGNTARHSAVIMIRNER